MAVLDRAALGVARPSGDQGSHGPWWCSLELRCDCVHVPCMHVIGLVALYRMHQRVEYVLGSPVPVVAAAYCTTWSSLFFKGDTMRVGMEGVLLSV